MASITLHKHVETAAGQHSRSTSSTKVASALQGGLAASRLAEEEEEGDKATMSRKAPAAKQETANKGPQTSTSWRPVSARAAGAARKKKGTKKRAFLEGRWRDSPEGWALPASAQRSVPENSSAQHWPTLNAPTPEISAATAAWAAVAVPAPTPEVAAAQRLSESELAVLLTPENLDWAAEVEEEEKRLEAGTPAVASPSTLPSPLTQELILKAVEPVTAATPASEVPLAQKAAPKVSQALEATPILSSTLDEHDDRVNALIEELAAAQELRKKAYRRALLSNLPGLSASRYA
jgi:hypothetical protein